MPSRDRASPLPQERSSVAQTEQVYYITRVKDKVGARLETAVLDLDGADCASCAYAIEHSGRKIRGISDVHVDIRAHQARVVYQGEAGALKKLTRLVQALGYDARIRSDSPPPDAHGA